MNSCLCNEAVAYYYRWCRDTPEFQGKKLNQNLMRQIIDELVVDICEHFDNEPFDVFGFLKTKTGALGHRYRMAARAIVKDGFDLTRDSDIKAFIKNERYHELKKPRAIMGRNPKFNIFYAKFVTQVEQAFYKLKGVTAAKNYAEVGAEFQEMEEGDFLVKGDDNVMQMDGYKMEGDATSFESSQRDRAMQIEHTVTRRVFERMGFDDLDSYDHIFAQTCIKKGSFPNGFKFRHKYTNGSGEMNTTYRNTMLMYVAVRYFLLVNKGKKEHELENTFAYFGFDMKLIARYSDHDVGFCSGKFIKVNSTTTFFVHDLHKLLNSIPLMINHDFDDHLDSYYFSLGYMYAVLYAGIPVYEDLGRWLMTCKKQDRYVDVRALEDRYGFYNEFKLRPVYDHQVDTTLVISELMECFDISMPEINALQEHFKVPLNFSSDRCKVKRRARPVKLDDDLSQMLANYQIQPPTDPEVLKFLRQLRGWHKEFYR